MRSVSRIFQAVALTLLVPGASLAVGSYHIDKIVTSVDSLGVPVNPYVIDTFELAGLNDDGQVGFYAQGTSDNVALLEYASGALTPILKSGGTVGGVPLSSLASGATGPSAQGYTTVAGVDANQNPMLLQYGPNGLSTIARVGGEAPGGRWMSLNLPVSGPLSMNQFGNVVFAGELTGSGPGGSGTFLWNAATQQLAPITPAGAGTSGLRLVQSLWSTIPSLNNANEIAFSGIVEEADGTRVVGLLLLDRTASLKLVGFEGERLPNGDQIRVLRDPVLNDAGIVAFRAVRQSDQKEGVYRWENGTTVPTGVVEGGDAPGGGRFQTIDAFWLNSTNGNVLVAARAGDPGGSGGLYLFANGGLHALSIPGQTMPDGSVASGYALRPQVSASNGAGQIAFTSDLQDGGAAYLLEPDGTVQLILHSGAVTSVGTVISVGALGRHSSVIGLNNRGQVALPAAVYAPPASPDAILLLTPTATAP